MPLKLKFKSPGAKSQIFAPLPQLYIDFSMYSEFWRNPERCRLVYFKNIVPKKRPDYWTLGGMVHKMIEYFVDRGMTIGAAKKLLQQDEEYGKHIDEFWDRALRLVECFRMHRAGSGLVKTKAEQDFRFELNKPEPGKVLYIACGRIDEPLMSGKELIVGDIKTKNTRADSEMQWKWDRSDQISMYCLGIHGGEILNKPQRAVVTTIVDSSPPRVIEIWTERTPEQLQVFKSSLLQTCDTIVRLIHDYGIDTPWTHLINSYPCSMNRCEYYTICGQIKIDPAILKRDFKTRIEHLSTVKERFIK